MADWNRLVSEEPLEFGDHTYQARRSPDHDGMPRWEVYRLDLFAPIGYLGGHLCPFLNGVRRLFVFDHNSQRLPFVAKPRDADDGCVHSYKNALNDLRMHEERP